MAAKLVPPASKCWDGNFSALNNPSSRNVFTNDSRKFVVKTNYRSAKKAAAKKLRTNFGISARSDGGYIQSNYRLFIKLMTSSARCWSKKRPSPTLSTSSDHYWSELRKSAAVNEILARYPLTNTCAYKEAWKRRRWVMQTSRRRKQNDQLQQPVYKFTIGERLTQQQQPKLQLN